MKVLNNDEDVLKGDGKPIQVDRKFDWVCSNVVGRH